MTVGMLPTPRTLAAAVTCLAALVAGPAPTAPRPPEATPPRAMTGPTPGRSDRAPGSSATSGECIASVSLDAPPGAWIDVVLPPGWVADAGLPDHASHRAFGVRLPAASGAVDILLHRLTADAAPIHAEVHHDSPQGPISERWPITGCGS